MKFKLKVLTSFILTITFLVASLSGLAMYLAPKGRIANWVEWTWLGFTKDQWSAIHIVFVTVFLTAGILHLFYFNWKVFWAYLKQRAKKGVLYKWELGISIFFGLILWFGTVYEVKPVISVVKLAESIQESYETEQNQPPVPHAEEMTIAEFADEVLGIPVEDVLMKLSEKGYPASGDEEIIGELAEKHGVAPGDIYNVLSVQEKTTSKIAEFSGYGQKTLVQVCGELEIELKEAKALLEQAGITKFNEEETLKDIADRHDKKPIYLVKIIAGEE